MTTSFQNTTTQHDAGFKSSSSFARTSIVRSKCQRIDHTTTVSQIAWNCHKIKEEAHERRVRDETIISRGGRRTNGLAPKNCALPCQSPPLTCCSNSLAIVWCYMQCNTRTKATQTKFWDFFIWANQMSSKNEMSKKSSWVFFSKMHEMLKILQEKILQEKIVSKRVWVVALVVLQLLLYVMLTLKSTLSELWLFLYLVITRDLWGSITQTPNNNNNNNNLYGGSSRHIEWFSGRSSKGKINIKIHWKIISKMYVILIMSIKRDKNEYEIILRSHF